MPGHHYTPAMFALQRIVEAFGNVPYQSEEAHLTKTYRADFRICKLENIEYLVLTYLNTGALPHKEFIDDWLFDGEA
jgi:hypothetical protein